MRAAAAAQAVGVPGILDDQLVRPAEGEATFGHFARADHSSALAVEHHRSAHHHVGVGNAAAEGKAAVEDITAIDLLQVAAPGGELPSRDHVGLRQ
jgi:hypothetical protein